MIVILKHTRYEKEKHLTNRWPYGWMRVDIVHD